MALFRKRLGAMGLKGRWKDFRIFGNVTAKEQDPRWWLWVVGGVLLIVGALLYVVVDDGAFPTPFALAIPGALLMRLRFDKKRGGPPRDSAATNAVVLAVLGLFLAGLGRR